MNSDFQLHTKTKLRYPAQNLGELGELKMKMQNKSEIFFSFL